MGLEVFIDGKFFPQEEAKISVWDHGFLYGDGIFEGIRAYNGKVFFLEEHLERLYASAKCIHLKIPMHKKEMMEAVLETCRINNLKDAYIRVVVSRGKGDLGIDPRNCSVATVVIIADKIALFNSEYYKKGIRAIVSSTRKNSPHSLNPQVKSLNYLNNIMAKLEAINAGVGEAIMLNDNGFITEGTAENVFMIKKGILKTPPSYVGILEGITRNVVLEIARKMNLPTQEAQFTTFDLYVADEVFLTGTAVEILPVIEIDGRIIGEGKPGKMTLKMQAAFRELTRTEGTLIFNTMEIGA